MGYYSQPERIPTLLEALNNLTVDRLKALANIFSDEKIPTRKAELVSYIHQQLKGEYLQSLWQQCDSTQQAVISEVVHSTDDRYQPARFVSKYGKEPTWGTGESYSYNYKPSILALFFYSYTMPHDLKSQLKTFVPEPEPTRIQSVESLPATLLRTQKTYDFTTRKRQTSPIELPLHSRATEQVARRDLQTVLRLVDLGKVSISEKTFYPTGATLTAVAEVLEEGDYYSEWTETQSPGGWKYDYPIGHIKPFTWIMLLQVGKLVELSGKRLALTKAGQKALNEPAEKTLQTLWKNWLKNTLLDELRRIDSIKGQTGKGKRSLTAVAGRRSKIVEALKDCPPGQWVELADFFRYIIAAGYEFEVSRNPDNLTISGYGSLDDSDFLILEARYILCFLFEYVSTLGLVDVAYIHPDDAIFNFEKDVHLDFFYQPCLSRYDGLTYFRLTPLGAYVLGLSDRYVPITLPQKQVLRVLANLEVVAVQQLTRADRLFLDNFLQPISDSVWQLEPSKLLDAIAQGRSVDELRQFLIANSSEALPQPVAQFLADLEVRTTSLQDLGSARLIRCTDTALATLIANDSRTKAYCFLADQPQTITAGQACYLVVPTETETKFRNALKKLGYTLPV
ncbi:MAG TPA: hypothetical protein V6D15_16965 [Oculatellaceae cyanobacterium]|jgi:hypothetical protein